MSRKGNGWDNALVEWFFSRLKREWLSDHLYRKRQEAIPDVREHIAVYDRLYSTPGYRTPIIYQKMINSVSRKG
ncbi:MAG: hypothetical protein GYB20_01085 [Oceanospirillales bacterium]|nr:hypothetical protein [Oceanospirillales bacterium]MBR9886283.1 hypothetical protein [Oceanospirillales bacterium]